MPEFDTRPYWRVVEDCLVELHGRPPSQARIELAELRAKLDRLPPGIDRDIIYHDEQFNVACDLAGKNLPPKTYRQRYDEIVGRHYPKWQLVLAARSARA